MSIGSVSFQSWHQQLTQFSFMENRVSNSFSQNVPSASPQNFAAQSIESIDLKLYAPRFQTLEGNGITAAAGNILNFMGLRLEQDTLEGATQDELQTRLQAGLDGFLRGYDEAIEILGDLSLLGPGVQNAVEQTRADVLSGIDALAEKYGLESPVTDAVREQADQAEVTASGQQDSVLPAADRSHTGHVRAYEEYNRSVETYQSRSFDFSLKTQDGDTLSIRVQNAQYSAYGVSESGTISGQQLLLAQAAKGSFVESGNFFLSVNGELDEDELKAIGDLLNDINDLAKDFYAGDIEQAFNEALELGYDSDEIMRFSLQLRMEQSVKVQETYQRFADYPAGSASQITEATQDNRLMLAAGFIQMLENIRLEAKEHKIESVQQLPYIAQLQAQEKTTGFADFASAMLEKLDKLSSGAVNT